MTARTTHVYHSDYSEGDNRLRLLDMLESYPTEDICVSGIELFLNTTIIEVARRIRNVLEEVSLDRVYFRGVADSNIIIQAASTPFSCSVQGQIVRDSHQSRATWALTDRNNYRVNFYFVAPEKRIEEIIDRVRREFPEQQLATIDWRYSEDGRSASSMICLDQPENVYEEFYPYLPNIHNRLDDYLKSSASILLLQGPPGTGKTCLLRNFIFRHKLKALVTYESRYLDTDSLFVNFLMGNYDIMIAEDADDILTNRESSSRLVSRLLNVSDGLIKLPTKKIVFTSNMTDFAMVDPALMRPGRCYGVMEFRHLTATEMKVAARVAGLADPHSEASLAQLFNQTTAQPKLRKVGF